MTNKILIPYKHETYNIILNSHISHKFDYNITIMLHTLYNQLSINGIIK